MVLGAFFPDLPSSIFPPPRRPPSAKICAICGFPPLRPPRLNFRFLLSKFHFSPELPFPSSHFRVPSSEFPICENLRHLRILVPSPFPSSPVVPQTPSSIFISAFRFFQFPLFQFPSSFTRTLRYSICPRSPSSPIPPDAGNFSASSRTSPFDVQYATLFFTTTVISFHSCGR